MISFSYLNSGISELRFGKKKRLFTCLYINYLAKSPMNLKILEGPKILLI